MTAKEIAQELQHMTGFDYKDWIEMKIVEYARRKCEEQREICAGKTFKDEVPSILNAPPPDFD